MRAGTGRGEEGAPAANKQKAPTTSGNKWPHSLRQQRQNVHVAAATRLVAATSVPATTCSSGGRAGAAHKYVRCTLWRPLNQDTGARGQSKRCPTLQLEHANERSPQWGELVPPKLPGAHKGTVTAVGSGDGDRLRGTCTSDDPMRSPVPVLS